MLPTDHLNAITVPGLRNICCAHDACQQSKLQRRRVSDSQAFTISVLLAIRLITWLLQYPRSSRNETQ